MFVLWSSIDHMGGFYSVEETQKVGRFCFFLYLAYHLEQNMETTWSLPPPSHARLFYFWRVSCNPTCLPARLRFQEDGLGWNLFFYSPGGMGGDQPHVCVEDTRDREGGMQGNISFPQSLKTYLPAVYVLAL